MNGSPEFISEFFNDFQANDQDNVEAIFCVPSPLIERLSVYKDSHNIKSGAEDCHYEVKGAYTGDISPELVSKLGADYVILGHSERRQYHFESDELVNKKVRASIANNLVPIICIGETEAEREQGVYKDVIKKQLLGSVPENISAEYIIAYEPVWAIGTGKVPTNEEIAEVFELITEELPNAAILYGGSANGGNCDELSKIPNLAGYLVGSASLKPEEFSKIVNSLA